VAELYLSVAHQITQTKTIAYKCFTIPDGASSEDIAEVIERFKRDELDKDWKDVDSHNFTYFLETKADRKGSGGLPWPL
jgi:hypothetical protein